MKTIEIKLYEFKELSDPAKEKALSDNYAINVDYDWWESTYEDAEMTGLKINGFELDRNKHCKIEFIELPQDVAAYIYNNHGSKCDSHIAAKKFLKEFDLLDEEDSLENLEEDFKNDLESCYANYLQNESEYLMSEEAIKETFEASEYHFTEEGKIYH